MTGILAAVLLLDADLLAALEKARAAERYAFKLEPSLQGGENTNTAVVEGRFEKGLPVWLKAGEVEYVRKGELLAVLRNGEWKKFEGRDANKRVRGQFTPSALRTLRLPHEELAGLAKQFKEFRKLDDKEGDQTVYFGELTEEAAKTHYEAGSDRRLDGVPAGTGRFWVTPAGDSAMVEIIVRIKAKKVRDSGASMWITLSEVGTAKAGIPEAAIRALD